MHNMDQRTAEWFQCRAGKVTASRIKDVMASIKTGEAAARRNYRVELALERLAGPNMDGFISPAMQRGIDKEPEARAAYERHALVTVTEVGFCDHPAIEMAGASPDGLVGDDGLVEIKCPTQATHWDTIRNGNVSGDYIKQMQWQMACTDRKWCDFASFDDRFPTEMQLFVQRIERDNEMIADMEDAVIQFLKELDAEITDVREQYKQKEAA